MGAQMIKEVASKDLPEPSRVTGPPTNRRGPVPGPQAIFRRPASRNVTRGGRNPMGPAAGYRSGGGEGPSASSGRSSKSTKGQEGDRSGRPPFASNNDPGGPGRLIGGGHGERSAKDGPSSRWKEGPRGSRTRPRGRGRECSSTGGYLSPYMVTDPERMEGRPGGLPSS